MKTITLMRHGKSSWEYDVSDDKRPLKSRGKNDAELVAKRFKILNKIPIDAIYSSYAKRAQDTCLIFSRVMDFEASKINVRDDLYDFSGGAVLKAIKSFDASLEHVAIFGHNYAFTSLVNMLGSKYLDNLPTSGLASINFNADNWSDISSGETAMLLFPKELR